MSEPIDVIRLHMHVKGRVQNVGFRAHVEHNARQLGLQGWVRNVGLGEVETVAEGERQSLERLAEAIQAGPRGSHVEEANVEWAAATGEFEHFLVRRSI